MSRFIRNVLVDATGVVVAATIASACGGDSQGQLAEGGDRIAMQPHVPAVTTVALNETTAHVPPATAAFAAPVSYDEAFAAFRKGNYEEARNLFNAYTGSNEADGQGQYMLGLAAWKTGDHVGANAALTRAVELNASSVKARTNLARVLLEQNRPREALPHIETAVELAPVSNEAWRVLGNTKAQLGEVEEALDAYRQAMMIDEQDAWSMNNYGLLLIRAGRSIDALPPLARAVELAPKSAMFLNNLGVALENSGDLGGARDAFTRALEADSTHAKAQISLERVTTMLGSTEIEPTDLRQFARLFEDEIRRWQMPNPLNP